MVFCKSIEIYAMARRRGILYSSRLSAEQKVIANLSPFGACMLLAAVATTTSSYIFRLKKKVLHDSSVSIWKENKTLKFDVL